MLAESKIRFDIIMTIALVHYKVADKVAIILVSAAMFFCDII